MEDRVAFVCSKCLEVFDRGDLGHCSNCDHHYVVGDRCQNCHEETIKNTMFHATFTVNEYFVRRRA